MPDDQQGDTSCGPLVCLCYTRSAMHGRIFRSAKVIVALLPLAFSPTRPSVGRTHHYRERMYSIRRFRTKLAVKRYIALLFILRIVILLFSATLGGGSTGVLREPRHRPLLLVSYRAARIREFPPPSRLAGRGSNIRSLWRPRPPMVANH